MSVSAPKPFSVGATAAKTAGPVASSSTNPFAKALTHHKNVHAALKAGNGKQAMHHLGHTLLAVRAAMKPAAAPAMPSLTPPTPSPSDISNGTEDASDSAPSASAPQKKPFNRAAFAGFTK